MAQWQKDGIGLSHRRGRRRTPPLATGFRACQPITDRRTADSSRSALPSIWTRWLRTLREFSR